MTDKFNTKRDGRNRLPSGAEVWYQNGQIHRNEGPAVTLPNGTEIWYQNGKVHRADGPAVLYPDQSARWYLDNKRVYSENKYQQLTGLDDRTMYDLVNEYGGLK